MADERCDLGMKQMTEVPGMGTDRDARSLAVLEAHAGRGIANRISVPSGVEVQLYDTPYWMWHDFGAVTNFSWAVTYPDSNTTKIWVWTDTDQTVGIEESDIATDSRDGWSAQLQPIENPDSPKLVVWRPAAH